MSYRVKAVFALFGCQLAARQPYNGLEPIPEPSGTVPFCGVLRAKGDCPPLPRRTVIVEDVMPRNCFVQVTTIVAILFLAPTLVIAEFTEDSLKTVRENVAKEKAVLVDVRSEEEWERGHLEGSIFLPVTALVDETADLDELTKDLPQDKILYTFCVVGIRADAAGEVLEELGYEVRVLEPGYKQLIKAGFRQAKQKQE